MKPPRDVRQRQMTRFAAPIALILLAAALGVIEYRIARAPDGAEFERTLTPQAYESVVTTDQVTGSQASGLKRIRVSAPLENAWMNVTATVVQPDGVEISSCRLYLDYFQRPQRGIHWTWGLPMASAVVMVPAGDYRLRLEVAVKPDTATSPPLHVQVVPAVFGSHARLLACAIATILGTGFLLRALAAPGAKPKDRDAARPPRPGGPDEDVARSSAPPAPASAGGEVFPAGRLHFIDGLRGIAAMGVLMCHLFVPEFLPSVRLIEGAFGNLIPNVLRLGTLGVEVFFVLSGFVIAYSIRGHPVTPEFIVRFIGRRFLRLDPPYYAAIFLAIVVMAYSMADSLHAVLHYFQAWKGLLLNLFYLQDIFLFRSPIGTVAWTLCLEVQFYLALVTLTGISQWLGRGFAAPATRARVTTVVWWLIFGALGVASVATWYPDHGNFNFLATWFRFLLGVLVFRCLAARANPWPFALLLGALVVLGITFSDPRGCTAAATAGVILIAGRAGALGRWLDGRFWQFFGRLSYSLYLHHIVLAIPFLAFVWAHVPHTLTFALLLVPFGIGVAIACAWIMYALIERPSIAVSQRIRYARRP